MAGIVCANHVSRRTLSKPQNVSSSQRIWSIRSVSSEGGSPSAGRSARWSLTIPARVRKSRSLAVTGAVIRSPPPRYADRSGLGIGRTPDGSDGDGQHTLIPDQPQPEQLLLHSRESDHRAKKG